MSYNKLKAWNFTFLIYTIITIGILFPDISPREPKFYRSAGVPYQRAYQYHRILTFQVRRQDRTGRQ